MTASSEKWGVKNWSYINIKPILLLFSPFFPLFSQLWKCVLHSLSMLKYQSWRVNTQGWKLKTEQNSMFNFFEMGGKRTSGIDKSQIKCFCYTNLTVSIKYSVCNFVWSGWDTKHSFARFVVVQLAEFYFTVLYIDIMQTGEKLRCTALAWSSFITNTPCLYQYLLQDNSLESLDGLHTISWWVNENSYYRQIFSKTTAAQNLFLPSGKFVVSFDSTIMEGLMI